MSYIALCSKSGQMFRLVRSGDLWVGCGGKWVVCGWIVQGGHWAACGL